MDKRNFIDDSSILQRKAQGVQSGGRQFRPFNTAHQVLIGERIQIRECFHIPLIYFARESERIALDAVKHRRSQPRADRAVRAEQVFQQDG